MREIVRSPSEYYIRYLLTRPGDNTPNVVMDHLTSLQLDGMSNTYLRDLAKDMELQMPDPFEPDDPRHQPSRAYLKHHKIFDMWHQTKAVREATLILSDLYLREKMEPMLLSPISFPEIARRLRKYTSIALTDMGVEAFSHYFWNRSLLTQSQWMSYLEGRPYHHEHKTALMVPPDVARRHMPWVVGLRGPSSAFNSAEAAARVGQIAFKHALELERMPANMETTMSLKNCMVTIEKADQIMRRSDVALRDVLKQFQKFRIKLDDAEVIDVQQLTEGNYSKSGEGTDLDDEDDF